MSRVTSVGILGGGQLGRMLALAARPLGIECVCVDPDPGCPASHVADLIVGAYDDPRALAQLARRTSVVTTEFENVPVAAARWLGEHAAFFPGEVALATAQERLAEKTLFASLGIPTPRYAAVESEEGVRRALEICGTPCVFKTRRMGYDGKGQMIVREAEDAARVWTALGRVPLIAEQFVPFDREVSILAVRSTAGDTAFYPLIENHHAAGILRLSLAPAPGATAALQSLAQHHAARVLDRLRYVGVLCIEFFQQGDTLIASEMACRVHNSGHWTIEGAACSQFENHIRAVAGLPLGDTRCRGATAMVNLIGGVPDPRELLAIPGAHLHLYDKAPRPARKVGHVTITGASGDREHDLVAALSRVRALADASAQ